MRGIRVQQTSMKRICFTLIVPGVLFLTAQVMNDGLRAPNDAVKQTPYSSGVIGPDRTMRDTAMGDIVFQLDVQTPTNDFQLLGVEFDGTCFYVTGGNAGADPNKVYVIDTTGNLVMALDQPDLPDYWGWRDLAWDGTYSGPDRIDTLYGSYGTTVHKFGICFTDSALVHYGSFHGPAYPINRALAYMPDSAWFFTNSGDTLDCVYKFSKTEPQIDSCLNNWHMYGAAYDHDIYSGGYVWWHSQDNTGTTFDCLIEQMDPFAMEFTGVTFACVPAMITSGIAGGLCFYEGFRGMDVLFALVQGDPVDMIAGIFLRHDEPGIAEEENVCLRLHRAISCYPNPARGSTHISFVVDEPGHVSLKVYDRAGRLVRTLLGTAMAPGAAAVHWDGLDDHGTTVPTGVYFIRLAAPERQETAEFTLLR